jgi:hypothetical protein
MTAVAPGACDCCEDCWGKLEVLGDGGPIYPLSLNKQAWCVTNGWELWDGVLARGSNITIPGLAGRKETPRRADQKDYSLPFIVSGVVDENDTPTVDDRQGLVDNLAYLRANAFDPLNAPDTSRVWQLTTPDGSTVLTADVQPPERADMLVASKVRRGLWIGTLHITIPAGAFF